MLKYHSQIPSTKLEELVALKALNSTQAMLPSALKDSLLLSLTKDLRLIDRPSGADKTEQDNLAPPLYLVLELLMRADDYGCQRSASEIPDHAIDKALGLLHISLEREIVGRVLGVGADDLDKQFLASLDQCMPSKFAEPSSLA